MTQTITPDEWRAKNMANLRRAQRTKRERYAVVRAVRAGAMTIGEALDDPRAGSFELRKLLTLRPGYGRKAMQKRLALHHLSERKRVRDLTDRQRKLLAYACDD